MFKFLVPFTDSIEFLTLALDLSGLDVLFIYLHDKKNALRDDRFVKASVIIQDEFRKHGGTATFVYTNIHKELQELSARTKFNIKAGLIMDAIVQSIAQEAKREVLIPYSIADYYLNDYILRGMSPFQNQTKAAVYLKAEKLHIELETINQYRKLDMDRIDGLGLHFKDIEWAHQEMKKDGWKANLENNYTEQQREFLQFIKSRKYEN